MAIEFKTIPIKFNERYSNYFDSIYNCEISNRKSDRGLIEKDRPQIWPRPGTSRIGNEIIKDWSSATAYVIWDYVVLNSIVYKCILGNTNQTPPNGTYWVVVSAGQSKLFFYTDLKWVRRLYRVFDSNLQYINGSTWTTIKAVGTNDVEFSTQRVPVNVINDWNSSTAYIINDKVYLNWVTYICILGNTNQTPPNVTYWTVSTQDSTNRTSPTLASGPEKVMRDAADTLNGNNNIGTILLITSGIYKGCYAPIISYSSAWGWEYSLGWSGVITALPAATTYKRFDTIKDVLQVARWDSNLDELYFNGIVENTWIQWYSTLSLLNVAAISTWQALKKMVTFNNYSWTFSGSTLYYTGWYPGNPLFFNYTWSLSLGGNWSIVDIFQYKTRLVVLWTNFVFSVNQSLGVDRHITVFGGIKDAYVNTGDDVYFLTTQKTLLSMSETINWVVGIQSAGLDIDNFISLFNTKIAFGYDSKKIYLYWQEDANTSGTMCVLDIKRKMWIFYTGIRIKSFLSEWSIMYMSDNNSDIVRIFDVLAVDVNWRPTDVSIWTAKTNTIAQSLELKEIDLSDIFSPKTLAQIYISFENYTQSIVLDTYMGLNRVNWKKNPQVISVTEVEVGTLSLWEWTVWENTFWESGMLDTISVPVMEKKEFNRDNANIFKIAIAWNEWSPFYMNEIDLVIGFSQTQKTYFDPLHTF